MSTGATIAIVLAIILFIVLAVGIAGWVMYGKTATETTPIVTNPVCNKQCNPSNSYLDSANCKCQCFPGFVANASGECVSKTCATGYVWNDLVQMCIQDVTAETPIAGCGADQTQIMKDDGTTICATTNKSCDGYMINGRCVKRNCSDVPCRNGGSLDDDCVCKCAKGFSGRDCGTIGCVDTSGNPVNRCYNGKLDSTTCRCNCDDGFNGVECNIFSGVSSKKDCEKKDKAVWTGLECISTKGESPFPAAGQPRKSASDFTCYENVGDAYHYIHAKSATDPWQCYLGDNVNGIIGDETSYLYGQRCIGGESKQECLDIIAKLV